MSIFSVFSRLSVFVFVFCSFSLCAVGEDDSTVPVDSRIKMFIHNPNDVYDLTLHYRYQSTISFGKGEIIRQVAVGDMVGWDVKPTRDVLFIKPTGEGYSTNLHVTTNRRKYLFGISAVSDGSEDEDMTYDVRFFYPEDAYNGDGAMSAGGGKSVNYGYSISGAKRISPIEVFDDGGSTYLKFSRRMRSLKDAPMVGAVSEVDGKVRLLSRNGRDDTIVVSGIHKRLVLVKGSDNVDVVFNR